MASHPPSLSTRRPCTKRPAALHAQCHRINSACFVVLRYGLAFHAASAYRTALPCAVAVQPCSLEMGICQHIKRAKYVPGMRQVTNALRSAHLQTRRCSLVRVLFADMPGAAELKRTTCSHSTLPVESIVMPRHHALEYRMRAGYNSSRTCQGPELAAQQKLVMRLSCGPLS